MFKGQNFLFNTVPSTISILLVNYKINLFKSLTNYSISSNFNTMYTYITSKKLNISNLSYILPYNFLYIKNSQTSAINNYFFYFLRMYFFFLFFFKKLASNLYNIILINLQLWIKYSYYYLFLI